jgi:phage repressor protein C with HTH and peptisase S24 domain
MFVQQRKFEKAIAAGVKSLGDLEKSMIVGAPDAQLRFVSFEHESVKREAFKTLLPLYSIKAAAGYFGNGEAVEPERWVECGNIGKLDERMFVCRVAGRSMEPTIRDGDYAVFRSHPTGTRQSKIVLAQYRGPADPDTGGSFTVKKYSSEKELADEGGWRHKRVVLSPINPDYQPIVFSQEDADHIAVIAEFVAVLGK